MSEAETQPVSRGRRWRILVRVSLGAVSVIVLLLIAGSLYEAAALKRIRQELVSPGELIDIGGRNLHVMVQGSGNVTVLLEAGTGGGVLDWALIAPEVAKFASVVSYDRAGLGWSDAAPEDTSASRIVRDLSTALDAASC